MVGKNEDLYTVLSFAKTKLSLMNYKENKNTFDITNSLAKNSQFLKIQNTLQRKQNAVKQTINFYKLFGRLLI